MRDYRKIEAWKLADDVTVALYEATRGFPKEEMYGLTSQLRRAAYSAPANIAEGASRDSKRDYLHFLYIARGSLNEASYFVHLSCRLKYLPDAQTEVLMTQMRSASACLYGLIRAVERESGIVRKLMASATSALCLLLVHGPRSMVHGL